MLLIVERGAVPIPLGEPVVPGSARRPARYSKATSAASGRCIPGREVPALIPIDQQVRKVLELTFREALRLGHNYIGTEHILLALLELEDSEGVLSGLGIDKAAAQAQVAAALAAIQAAHQGQ